MRNISKPIFVKIWIPPTLHLQFKVNMLGEFSHQW